MSAALVIHWQNRQQIDEHVSLLVEKAGASITESFERFEYGLRATRGAIIAAGLETLNRQKFENFVETIDVARNFTGALGFGFIRRVPVDQESLFIEGARADGAPGFSLRFLNEHPGDRYVIQYIYPTVGNKSATGLDIASEDNRRTAAIASARDNAPRLTAPITLVQADGKWRRGFLILLPVFQENEIPQSPAARMENVAGWAYAPLIADDILEDIGDILQQTQLSLSDPRESEPFFKSQAINNNINNGDNSVTRTLLVMGQEWRLSLQPDLEIVSERAGILPVASVIIVGVAITLFVVLSVQISGARLVAASERTSNARFEGDGEDFVAFFKQPQFRQSILTSVVAVTLLLALIGWFVVQSELSTTKRTATQLASDVEDVFEQAVAHYRRNVLFLASTPSVMALQTANPSSGGSPESLGTVLSSRVEETFKAYMSATPAAQQVRFIAGDDNAREWVRVQRSGEDLSVVSSQRLQQKANRSYVSSTLSKDEGDVYVSAITLNRDFGALTLPHDPQWRFATPLFSDDGAAFGLVIINISAKALLKQVEDLIPAGSTLHITNQDGDFLQHPQASRAFAYEVGQPFRWDDEYEAVDSSIGLNISGLSKWRGPFRTLWTKEITVIPDDSNPQNGLSIRVSQPVDPVYQRIAIKIAAAFIAIFVALTLGLALQYRNWLKASKALSQQNLEAQEVKNRKERAFLKAILESSPDAMVIVDNQGTIKLANQQAQQLFGYSREQLEGHAVEKLIPPQLRAVHSNHFAHFLEHPERKTMNSGNTLPALTADGREFPAEIRLGPLETEDGIIISAAVRDVSEKIEQQKELQHALNNAEQASIAKSAFLANTSHEIRTPLNAIIGLTHLLREENLSGAQHQLVDKIQMSGRSLLGIVNDVLDLSKIEADEMVLEQDPIDLRELLEEVVGVFAPQAEAKGLKFKFRVEQSVPKWIVSDVTRLRQILVNLLSNALKFTSVGQIVLGAEIINGQSNLERLRLFVEDTGIGVPTEKQPSLFQPFTQADVSTTRRFGGTGLGLSIVGKLGQLLGGDVGFESREGLGSTFWLEMPLRTRVDPGAVSEKGGIGAGFIVMVIEDSQQDIDSVIPLVKALGWRAQSVAGLHGLQGAFSERIKSGFSIPDALIFNVQNSQAEIHNELAKLLDQVTANEIPAIITIGIGENGWDDLSQKFDLIQRSLQRPVDASSLFNAANDTVSRRSGDANRVMELTRIEAVKVKWLPNTLILVVDDSPINVEVVTQILEQSGSRVISAQSGEEALTVLDREGTTIDAVLMDVQMPGIDGLETTRRARLKSDIESLPILALTAGAFVEEKQRALASGMNDVLTKPIDPSKLINTLRRVIEQYRCRDIAIEPLNTGEIREDQWPQIEGLDQAQAQRFLMNDKALFLKTLDRMIEQHANLAEPVGAAIDEPSSTELRLQIAAQCHKLRSSSGMVGAQLIQALAAEVEELLKSPDSNVEPSLEKLALALGELISASRDVLKKWRREREAVNSVNNDTNEIVHCSTEDVSALVSALASSDLVALDLVEHMKAGLHSTLGEKKFSELQRNLERLNFDSALAALAPLQKNK
ncbi:CHASE domain-containing protein [Marinobacter mobilis]|nr:CHASE domain-containing protein [Marinobacter mobilis]